MSFLPLQLLGHDVISAVYFGTLLSIRVYKASNYTMTSKEYHGKDLEGSGRGLL
jgi:hypothetical protein